MAAPAEIALLQANVCISLTSVFTCGAVDSAIFEGVSIQGSRTRIEDVVESVGLAALVLPAISIGDADRWLGRCAGQAGDS